MSLPLPAPVPKFQPSLIYWQGSMRLGNIIALVFLKSTQFFNCQPALLPPCGPSFCWELPAVGSHSSGGVQHQCECEKGSPKSQQGGFSLVHPFTDH